MAEPYKPIGGTTPTMIQLYSCQRCGAATANRKIHDEWHAVREERSDGE